ncbi:hypothetical protein HAV15_011086 [Penicillium sp. str. |nr:hypothetical protein HAV15_011086 [Penicillium sp. str. \
MLAGVKYSVNIFTTVNVTAHAATATSDRVAVAEFFCHVGNAALDGLFATKLIGSVFSVSLATPRIILLLPRRTIEEGCISTDWYG